MRVRHYAQGKFYTIDCPQGTRLVRCTERPLEGQVSHDILVVPLKGREIRIPADPPELLPMLAESGNFGVSLVGVPEPEGSMVGVVCPECGQDDVAWLQLREGLESVRCDACGMDFELPILPESRPHAERVVDRFRRSGNPPDRCGSCPMREQDGASPLVGSSAL